MTASNGKWLEQKPQSGAEAVHGGSEKKSSPSHPQSKSSSAEPAREFNGVFSGVYDALLIGAGLSSIACASRLSQAGQRTLILEKSRGVGGRLATRRLALSVPSQGGAETSSVSESQGVLDSGAQKVEVSDERFLRALQAAGAQSAFSDLGLAKSGSWIHPRGMSQLAKQLVTQQHGGELVLQTQVTGLRGVNHSPQPYWQVECQGGAVYQASSLVISAPMPQAQALMQTIPGVQWGSQLEELWALPYDPCFALMLVLEGDPQSEALESGAP
ncbi:MAG: FAD-dependent oxidoreductase, partial [Bdellovibrionia bacterium]